MGTIAVESGPQALSFAPALDGIKARIEKANQEGELGARTITLVDARRHRRPDPQRRGGARPRRAGERVRHHRGHQLVERIGGVPERAGHPGRRLARRRPRVGAVPRTCSRSARAPQTSRRRSTTTRNAELLEDLGVTKVALIGGGNQQSALFVERLNKSINQASDMEIVYENATITPDARDFTSEVQAIKDAGADGVDHRHGPRPERRAQRRPGQGRRRDEGSPVPRRLRPARPRAARHGRRAVRRRVLPVRARTSPRSRSSTSGPRKV